MNQQGIFIKVVNGTGELQGLAYLCTLHNEKCKDCPLRFKCYTSWSIEIDPKEWDKWNSWRVWQRTKWSSWRRHVIHATNNANNI